MNQFLTGAGHFGFGFLIGTCLMIVLIFCKRKSLRVQLYSPFLPFLCGVVAAIPYVVTFNKTCDLPLWSNAFLFFSYIHCNSAIVSALGNIHLVGVLCGIIYCCIIWRYIQLVKRVRRYGWSNKRK